jgi:hypothetical protein
VIDERLDPLRILYRKLRGRKSDQPSHHTESLSMGDE